MRLYLAGPMTGIPQHNAPAFDAAAATLRALCFDVVSPPEITRANPQPGIHRDGSIELPVYQELVRLDLQALLDCDGVALLPGWMKSRGARLEVANALAIGLDVFLACDLIEHGMNATPLNASASVAIIGDFGLPSLTEIPCADVAGELDDHQGDASRVVLGQGVA